MLKTLKLCATTLLVLHLAACLFCGIAYMEEDIFKSWIHKKGLDD